MAFFSRPDLSSIQFKQLEGSVLTLSGQTQIATTSGLTLTDGSGNDIILTASGASDNFDVLTYCNGVISLQTPTASGGTGIYDCSSPTTYAVGGLPADTAIYGSGITTILECILVPTLNPALASPSLSSFTISPSILLYEMGTVIDVTGTTDFYAGSINPQYTSASSCRSNGVFGYSYNNFGVSEYNTCSLPTGIHSFGAYTINSPSNLISSSIHYCDGVQPKNSSGGNYNSPLPSGYTSSSSKTISGVHPWFWGTSITAPTIGQSLIDNLTCKCVQNSNNTIIVNNFNVDGEYIWFAIPDTSTTKTRWWGENNVSNVGFIPGSLFPAGVVSTVDSPSCDVPSCWTGIQYCFYISSYPTDINYGMTFCN